MDERQQNVPGDVDLLLRVLRDHPDGLTRPDLFRALQAQLSRIQPQQVRDALARAGDAVVERQGRIFVRETDTTPSTPADTTAHPLRVIAVDSESVVRLTTTAPYTEAHLYQLGAVRFGPDQYWVHAQQEFNAFVRLDPVDQALFQSESVERTYRERARPRAEVLAEFREFVRDADVLVAYNGLAHDFALLDEECRREGVPPISAPSHVDGLYLALALWPVPPRHHRLRVLCEHLQLGVDQFTWHDALDDAKMLAILLEHGARAFAARAPDLRALIASAANDSPPWALLFALADDMPAIRPFSEREAGNTLAAALAPKPAQRLAPMSTTDAAPRPVPALTIADALWQDGVRATIDVHKLAAAAKRGVAEPRPAQDAMARQMRSWVASGVSALVEAPTGTGKTYPMIATALEWLAADSEHRVIISTFTKQLQLQLARDIEELGGHAVPGLIAMSDMVKGTSNRLSLRAVAFALAQMTDPRPRPRGGRPDYSRDPRFRDLVIYLALRLIAPGTPTEEWEARSVDPVDVPAFFDDYCGRRRTLYLLSLSQARSGELDAGSGGLAQYAATVEESLRDHRLIIANHALLLANLGDLAALGPKTLLFVDEAHTLESAVTDAIGAAFASTDLEDLASDVAAWRADQPEPQLAGVDAVLEDIGRFLGSEVLPNAAIRAFDAADRRGPGPEYPRRIVVGSPFVSESHARTMRGLGRALEQAARFTRRLAGALRAVPPRMDAYENERLNMLRARTNAVDDALAQITADLTALSTQNTPPPGTATAAASTSDTTEQVTIGDAESADGEEGEVDPEGLPLADAAPSPAPPPQLFPPRNRVIWAEELPGPGVAAQRRAYRFRVTSSPIELAQEAAYQRFTRTFARTYYVSATLRVAGEWNFMLDRLGLRGAVETIALPSPFDTAAQARLVCLSDFPSWAEEPERATKTVAHQVTGFMREAIDGARNGAMVLTTAKATAAGIAEHMVQMRAREDGRYPVFSTELLGNQRAVETFKEQGGALVGTKGLWQGVDIADPERLRLVVVNKLPFASFVDPIVATRRALIRERADDADATDPDGVANETYYLPLAAIELRQAVGRLIRTRQHRGAVIVTDRKLAGSARLNRQYRDVFLGSLDPGLAVADPETGERWGGNVVSAKEGWRRLWEFFGGVGVITSERASELTTGVALDQHTELPETLAIRREALTENEVRELRAKGEGAFREDFLARCARIGGYLRLAPGPVELKDKQHEALAAIAAGRDLLAVLPTGYGKSFCFQLPALALPGVTIVVSPLVALMTDQALALNRSIGGAVRALVAPMRESNSRTGKSEIQRQLTDPDAGLGIRLVYLSPERLCQRQFQDWIRRGAELGIVRRIAIDEAHTFVQWGDDFRPSFRRAELFLRDLKTSQPDLQLLAFTATANETVRDELRRALFGLGPGTSETARFAFVRANPIRTNLALYRRSFGARAGGHVRVSGLLERVVDTLQDHAIFYCLTIREVEAYYAHLRDYLGDQRDRVRRYHGRMSSVERAAVANDFRAAPRQGEEGFRPMIIVATSAFGLGIDRPDIRCVFVVSPPTDLAALYQQLGRAGRDGGGGTGLALATLRSLNTVFRMTRRAVDAQLVMRAAHLILASAPLVNLRRVAQDLIAEDLEAHLISAEEAARQETEDRLFISVVRVLAELASTDQIDDLGDFPMEIAVKRGVVLPDSPEMVEWVDAVLNANGAARKIEIPQLYERLHPRFGDELGDHGAFWSELLRLHTSGYLDVSQAPNVGRGYLTAIRVRDATLRPAIVQGLQRRQRTLDLEFTRLGEFFRENDRCANDVIAQYFGMSDVPEGTCAAPLCRCSSCWNDPDQVHAGDSEPALYEAFTTPDPAPQAALTARRQRDLDRYVERLLWLNYHGLGEAWILKVLRGEEMYRWRGQLRRLPTQLMNSNIWNARPGIRLPELQDALQRLVAAGVIAQDDGRWRLARNLTASNPVVASR